MYIYVCIYIFIYAVYSNGKSLLYSTDDGLINRPIHVLQIEKYCHASSCTI